MTDITPEGYNSYMEKQGYVIRLEPDGGTLKNKIQKLQKNFWQNEPVTDVRVSQASRRIEILSLWIYVLLNPNITMNWYQIMTILKVDIHHA